MLRAEQVEVRYGATTALSGVDLEFSQGELVAIVGPSGCGKSTLLHSLSGLQAVSSGRVVFDGSSLGDLSEVGRSRLRLRFFGMVFQSGFLVPELTILDNVALPAWLLGGSRSDSRERAQELLARLGIADRALHLPAEVSGGELQRAALGRALIHRPRVVFADEPTGALDSANSGVVFDLLCELGREIGSLVMVATHNEELAARCGRSIYLMDGTVRSDRSQTSGLR